MDDMRRINKKKIGIPLPILVVEDNEALCQLTVELLKDQGLNAKSVSTGTEAIDYVLKNPNTLMLLDQGLPDKTGKEVVSELNVKLEKIFFIMMTGLGDEKFAVEMMKLGSRDYIVKGPNFSELLPEVVKRTIKQISNERKLEEAEIALIESEEKYRSLFEYGSDMIFLLDPNSYRILDVNKNAARKLGYVREELLSMKLNDLCLPNAMRGNISIFKDLQNKGTIIFESAFQRKDRSIMPVEVSGRMLEYHGKTIVQNFVRDITMRKISEEEKLRLTNILEATTDFVGMCDVNGKVAYVNHSGREMVGLCADEDISKIFIQDFHPEWSYQILQEGVFPTAKLSGVWKGEVMFLHRNGKKIPTSSVIQAHKRPNGTVRYFSTISRDITEQKKAETKAKVQQQQLMQADKMSSLGTLVAGVAHEINNPNNFIMFNAPVLKKIWNDVFPILEEQSKGKKDFLLGNLPYLEARDAVCQLISGITEGSQRIKLISKKLKDFARQDPEQKTRINVHLVINSAVNLIEGLIKKHTDYFSVNFFRGLPPINGNFYEIEQVMLNLITNACQALTNKSQKIDVNTYFDEDSHKILIDVVDEGIGILPENLSKVTDPFFTTKRELGGTGLGLSVSYTIIKDHSGSFDFSSEPGKGTKIQLKFPAIERRN